jgi:hypothetical protein
MKMYRKQRKKNFSDAKKRAEGDMGRSLAAAAAIGCSSKGGGN